MMGSFLWLFTTLFKRVFYILNNHKYWTCFCLHLYKFNFILKFLHLYYSTKRKKFLIDLAGPKMMSLKRNWINAFRKTVNLKTRWLPLKINVFSYSIIKKSKVNLHETTMLSLERFPLAFQNLCNKETEFLPVHTEKKKYIY